MSELYFEKALTALFCLETHLAEPFIDGKCIERGCFSYIPLNNIEFFNCLKQAIVIHKQNNHKKPSTFLDVGCGLGVKSYIASWLSLKSSGIDINNNYIDKAQLMFPGCDFQTTNALEYNRYGLFDIIYFFRPMRDIAAQNELEKRITRQAKPGTTLIWYMPSFAFGGDRPGGVKVVDGSIYSIPVAVTWL